MEILFIQFSDDAYISISEKLTVFVLQGHILQYGKITSLSNNVFFHDFVIWHLTPPTEGEESAERFV